MGHTNKLIRISIIGLGIGQTVWCGVDQIVWSGLQFHHVSESVVMISARDASASGNTGLFGNFSQMADTLPPPPHPTPFWKPLT